MKFSRLLILLLCYSPIFAQSAIEYQTVQKLQYFLLTIENGLSNGDLFAIARESLVYMWLSSRQGLSRYNGHEFNNFYALPGITYSLSEGSITELSCSEDNILWIGTKFRLQWFLPHQNFEHCYRKTIRGLLLKRQVRLRMNESFPMHQMCCLFQ